MANRYGNRYYVALGRETALASGKTNAVGNRWEDILVLPCKMEDSPTRAAIDPNHKTGTAQATPNELAQGYYDGQIVLSGAFAEEYEELLAAYFQSAKEDDTYQTQDSIASPYSYVILRVYDDASSGTTPNFSYKTDKAFGCRLETLNITGASGGLIQFTATFRLARYLKECTELIIGATKPAVPTPTAFNFGSVDYSGNYGEKDRLKSFNLTLTNMWADDATAFANSNIRNLDILLKQEAELNLVGNYNQGPAEIDPMAEINGTSESLETISFTTLEFFLNARMTAQTLADPDRAIFETNVTLRGVAASGLAMLYCTIHN